jgi:glycosyltransferase involved in cell wall biosynthesis
MKKLIVVSDTFLPMVDGVATFIKQVIPRLKRNFEVTIIAPGYDRSRYELWEGMDVYKMPVCKSVKVAGYSLPVPRFGKMSKHIRSADVVFVQSGPVLGSAAVLLARLLKKPVVLFVHQIGWEQIGHLTWGPVWWKKIVSSFTKGLTKYICNSCDELIVPADEIDVVLKDIEVKTKVKCVPYGVDMEIFCPTDNRDSAKKAAGIIPEKVVIGFCGRFSQEKGIDTLIEAFKSLNSQYDNLCLLLVGDGEEEIKTKANSLKNSIITGFVNNVRDYYHAMDIYVSPSLTETTGLTILEALSCNLPVVATPVGFGLHLKDRQNAYIFPTKDVQTLKQGLEQLIADKEVRDRIARAGNLTVKGKYTWDNTAAEVTRILNNL